MVVSKRNIEMAKSLVRSEVDCGLWGGRIEKEVNGLVPMICVGQISPRKWSVFWNYQTKDTGDIATVPHPEDFISQVRAYQVQKLALDKALVMWYNEFRLNKYDRRIKMTQQETNRFKQVWRMFLSSHPMADDELVFICEQANLKVEQAKTILAKRWQLWELK